MRTIQIEKAAKINGEAVLAMGKRLRETLPETFLVSDIHMDMLPSHERPADFKPEVKSEGFAEFADRIAILP